MVLGEKNICLDFGRIVSHLFFLFGWVGSWENAGFPVQNHVFPRKKFVFHAKTIFFLRKLGISL